MPAVHIHNVPDDVFEALQRRAARHNRSLENELQEILSRLVRKESPLASLPPISLKLAQDVPADSLWRREEIYGDDGR